MLYTSLHNEVRNWVHVDFEMTLNHVLADVCKLTTKRFHKKDLKIDYDEPVKLNIANVINLHDVERKQI